MQPQSQEQLISVPFPEENGPVKMRPSQWAALIERLTEPCAYYLCEQLEDYAEQEPRKFAKYKDHYKVLLKWHERKVSNGYEFALHPDHGPGYYKLWVLDRLAMGARR